MGSKPYEAEYSSSYYLVESGGKQLLVKISAVNWQIKLIPGNLISETILSKKQHIS